MSKRVALAAAVIVSGLAFGSAAQAQSYHHIDQLAYRLELQARDLEREFATHFRHAAHFRHLMSDARKMAAWAHHIHDVAHHQGGVHHLQSDLQQLDRLFHHVERLLAHIEHDARRGLGHIHGHLYHVRVKMRSMSYNLHHLKRDVDWLARPRRHYYYYRYY